MKIITPGVSGKAWSMQVTCSGAGNGNFGCGARLEIKHTDVFITSSEGTPEIYTIICPVCLHYTDLADVKDDPYNGTDFDTLFNFYLPTEDDWKEERMRLAEIGLIPWAQTTG